MTLSQWFSTILCIRFEIENGLIKVWINSIVILAIILSIMCMYRSGRNNNHGCGASKTYAGEKNISVTPWKSADELEQKRKNKRTEIINEKSWNKPHFVNNLKLEWHTAGSTCICKRPHFRLATSIALCHAVLKSNANGIIQPFTLNRKRNSLFTR